MKKMKIMALSIMLALFTLPAFASGTPGANNAQKAIGASTVLAVLGGLATLKKSDGTEFTESEQELLGAIQKLLDQNASSAITKEALEQQLKDFREKLDTDSFEQLRKAINDQSADIKALQEGMETTKDRQIKTLMSMVSEQLSKDEVKAELKAMFGNKRGEFRLALKAAATMVVSTDTDIYQANYNPGMIEAPSEENRIINYVNMVTGRDANNPSETWLEKYDEEGNAEITDENTVKPLRSFKVRRITSDPKKVAVRERMSEEWLLFIPQMEQFIRQDILTALYDERDAHIISEISTAASTYVLTTINTTNPTNYDAIRAAVAQCRSLNHKPTHVLLNPIDAANFDISKGADGHYLYISAANPNGGIAISKLMVEETNQVTQGNFIVGDMKKYNCRELTDIIIKFVYSSADDVDDASRNLITVIGEQFLNTWMSQVDSTAFVEDSFANVKAAL